MSVYNIQKNMKIKNEKWLKYVSDNRLRDLNKQLLWKEHYFKCMCVCVYCWRIWNANIININDDFFQQTKTSWKQIRLFLSNQGENPLLTASTISRNKKKFTILFVECFCHKVFKSNYQICPQKWILFSPHQILNRKQKRKTFTDRRQ